MAPHEKKTLASGLLLATALLAGASPTAAAAELVLAEPAACVTLDELSFRVERLLGQSLASVEPLQLSVRAGGDATGFVARLEVERPEHSQRGVRSLRASSCAELLESLAIAIVVAVGEGEQPQQPPAEAPGPAPQAARAEPPPQPEPAADAAPPVGHGPTLTAAVWAIADSGTLPASALGAALAVGVSWRSLELRAIGTFLPEREGTLLATDPRSPGVSIGLIAAGLIGCVPVALQTTRLGMAVCAGSELGQLSGSGTHVLVPYHRQTLWAAARVELAARLGLGETPLALELLATALAPFTRDEFILRELGEIHRPASVIGRLGLGLAVAVD